MLPLKHKGRTIYNTSEKYSAIFEEFFPKIEDSIELGTNNDCPEGLECELTELNNIITKLKNKKNL